MVALPPDLAPSLRAAAEALLAECPEVVARREHDTTRGPVTVNRCVVCHRPGRLGGHHQEDGTVVWIHKGCHRHLHAASKGSRPIPKRRSTPALT